MTTAGRPADRDRRCATGCLFGVGAIERLPEVVAAAGGSRVFVVTDPGVRALRRHRPRPRRARRGRASRRPSSPRSSRTPAPRPSSAAPRPSAPSGSTARSSSRSAAARRWTRPRRSTCAPTNDLPVWELEYDGPDLRPAARSSPSRRPPGTGAETNSFGVITDEAAGRKGYIGHPSLLPGGDDPRPDADRRAAAGRHGRDRDRRDDPLARIAPVGQPEPVRRGDGARRRSGRSATWLRAAVADGTDLEARSQMLMASHLAGVGQASGTGVGLVHALGHSIGTRGKVAHGTALGDRPPRGPALLPRHARPRARARRDRARRRVRRRDGGDRRRRRDRRHRPAPPRRRPAARRCGALGLADDAAIDQLVTDTLDDAAIRNSPRLPTPPRPARSSSPSRASAIHPALRAARSSIPSVDAYGLHHQLTSSAAPRHPRCSPRASARVATSPWPSGERSASAGAGKAAPDRLARREDLRGAARPRR